MNLMMTVLGAFLAAPPPLKRWGRMRCVWVRKRGVGESVSKHKCLHLIRLKSRRRTEQTGPVIARTSVHFYILSSPDTKAKIFGYN